MRLPSALTAAVLVAALGLAPEVAEGQVPAEATVVDFGGVRQLFIAAAGQTEWGVNVLPANRGSHMGVSLPQRSGCVFNVRAVRHDGGIEEAWNLNWCRSDIVVIYVACSETSWCTLKKPAGPAPGAFREVDVMNGLDDFPRGFYIAPAEDTSWGAPHPLNRDWTPTGFTLLGGYCVYHVKIVHKSGRVSYYPNHNACTSQVFTIKGSGVAEDPLARAVASAAPSRPAVHDKQIKDCISGTDPKLVLEQCKMAIIMMAYTDEERTLISAARGRANRRLADYPEAIKWLGEAIAENPRDARSLNERGLTHGALRNYAAAFRDYDAAVRLNPDEPVYLSNRASSLMWLGQYDRAEADASRAVSLAPQRGNAYNRRGLVRRQRGNYPEALADFSQAISLDPKDQTYLSNRGITYLLAGDLTPALDDLNRAIELENSYALPRFARGVLFARQGRKTESDADLKAARAVNPSIDDEMKRLGVTIPAAPASPTPPAPASDDRHARVKQLTDQAHDAFDRGDLDAASAAAYSAVLVMGADSDARVLADPYNLEGVIRLRRGKFEAAATSFAMATMADESQAVYWVNYAYATLRSGKDDLARYRLDKALALDARNVEALFMRAVVRLREGDRPGSDADLKAARALRSDIDAHMANLGITLARSGG